MQDMGSQIVCVTGTDEFKECMEEVAGLAQNKKFKNHKFNVDVPILFQDIQEVLRGPGRLPAERSRLGPQQVELHVMPGGCCW